MVSFKSDLDLAVDIVLIRTGVSVKGQRRCGPLDTGCFEISFGFGYAGPLFF